MLEPEFFPGFFFSKWGPLHHLLASAFQSIVHISDKILWHELWTPSLPPSLPPTQHAFHSLIAGSMKLVVWSWYLWGMLSNLKFPQASFSLNINYYFDISSPVRIICILLFVWHIPFTCELSSTWPDFVKKILQTSCSFINSISLATRGIILNHQHYLSS